MLSDDELARYGEIAHDQAAVELDRWWVPAALLTAAAGVMAWTLVKWGIASIASLGLEVVGFGRSVVAGIGAALALAYWPYRRVRNWALWNRHCKAVHDEQQRRLAAQATNVRIDVAR